MQYFLFNDSSLYNIDSMKLFSDIDVFAIIENEFRKDGLDIFIEQDKVG